MKPITKRGGGTEGQVLHVVARSSGAHRHYYYRRYEYGYWTPWEQIKLDIEDNPVIPVVWNNRLLLFWLRILKKGPDTARGPTGGPGTHLTDLTIANLPADPKVTVQAVLCWSEYYNGNWQAAKTSDINAPINLGDFAVGAFDRSSLQLSSEETPDGLQIEFSVTIEVFLLYNTHSLPVHTIGGVRDFGKFRVFTPPGTETARVVIYNHRFFGTGFESDVLSDQLYKTVQPNHPVSDIWQAPYFFEDRRNTFYVTAEEKVVWVSNFQGFGISISPGVMKQPHIPPLVVQPSPKPSPWPDGGPIGSAPNIVDPAPMERFVTEDAHIRRGLGTSVNIAFGDRQIGPLGAIANVRTEIQKA